MVLLMVIRKPLAAFNVTRLSITGCSKFHNKDCARDVNKLSKLKILMLGQGIKTKVCWNYNTWWLSLGVIAFLS